MRKKHTFLFRVVTYLVGFKVIKNHQTLRLTCLAFQMADEWPREATSADDADVSLSDKWM